MKIFNLAIPNTGDELESSGSGTTPQNAPPPPSIDIMSMFAQDGNVGTQESASDENPPVGDKVSAETPAATPDAPPAPTPHDQLAKTTEALAAAVSALTQRTEAPAPRTEEPKTPKVWLTPEQIPQAMVQLLTSEDPAERVKGLAVYGNALVTMLYEQFQRDVTEQYQPQFQAMVQDHYRREQLIQNFRTDITTNYPVLANTEAGRLVAQHVVQKISAARLAAKKSVDWFDPDFRKDFDAELKILGVDPKNGKAAPAAPAPRPTPVGRSNGARPVQPAPENQTQADHMMSMLATVMPRAAN